MKRKSTMLAAAVTLALAPALSWGMAGGEGLNGTPHDFTTTGTGDVKVAGIGVCTFCHTPHKALSTLLLWNHTLSTNTFKWDVAATTAGTSLPGFVGNVYKGTSAKCLSCHDGSVAIGDIAWFQEGSHTGGSALTATKMTDLAAEFQVGVSGNMAGNHPVAVPYPLGNTANTYNGSTSGAGLQTLEWQPNPVALNTPGTSMIRLFQDDGSGNMSAIGAGTVTKSAGIECSSCHDPHNKASVDDLFLRGKLIGSTQADGYICVQCHKK